MNTQHPSSDINMDTEGIRQTEPSGKYAYFTGEQNHENYEYIRTEGGNGLSALNGEGTIATWIFRENDEIHDWRNVYDIPNSHLLEFVDDGGFDWRAENNSSDFYNINGPNIGNGEWQHITLRMKGDGNLDQQIYTPEIFIDGVLQQEEFTSWQIGNQNNQNGLFTTEDPLYLGILWSQASSDENTAQPGNPDPWKGGIDDFKIWSTALSDKEIYDNYLGLGSINNEKLLLHYDFENTSNLALIVALG